MTARKNGIGDRPPLGQRPQKPEPSFGKRKRTSKQNAPGARKAAGQWRAGINGLPCAICGSRRRVQAHHIVTKNLLRRITSARSWTGDVVAVIWDERNRLPLCEDCHGRYHAAALRIYRSVLEFHTPNVFTFAREVGREAINQLERGYPVRNERTNP